MEDNVTWPDKDYYIEFPPQLDTDFFRRLYMQDWSPYILYYHPWETYRGRTYRD